MSAYGICRTWYWMYLCVVTGLMVASIILVYDVKVLVYCNVEAEGIVRRYCDFIGRVRSLEGIGIGVNRCSNSFSGSIGLGVTNVSEVVLKLV